MESLFNVKNEKLRTLFVVLFFGGLWGIVEATLGTILHLPVFETTKVLFSSSTIIVPIALAILAGAYRQTEKLRVCIYVGLVAASIKLTTAFFLGWVDRVYNPALYIVVESMCMMGALAIFRPKNVISFKTFAAIAVAMVSYQMTYLVHAALTGSKNNAFASLEAFNTIGVKYLFTTNAIALTYTLAVGSICYGIKMLLAKKDIKVSEKVSQIAFSPIVAALAVVCAVTLTILL